MADRVRPGTAGLTSWSETAVVARDRVAREEDFPSPSYSKVTRNDHEIRGDILPRFKAKTSELYYLSFSRHETLKPSGNYVQCFRNATFGTLE